MWDVGCPYVTCPSPSHDPRPTTHARPTNPRVQLTDAKLALATVCGGNFTRSEILQMDAWLARRTRSKEQAQDHSHSHSPTSTQPKKLRPNRERKREKTVILPRHERRVASRKQAARSEQGKVFHTSTKQIQISNVKSQRNRQKGNRPRKEGIDWEGRTE